MANTQKYLNHLLQNTGVTPACSEEERLAAEDIAKIFRNHGFEPEMQEFTAPPCNKLAIAVMGILVFLGAVFMGIGGALGIVGFIFTLVAAVLYALERMGKPLLSRLGSAGLSQNVIAYHKATGPLASPRNRPVVVVAHYDSPRSDMLSQYPYAPYRATLLKLFPIAMFVPVVVAVIRLLPLPGALKIILWIFAIVAALVPLAFAVNAIANRFFLPLTSGAVCNKSSVAAMLGVMDAVSAFEGGEEFPNDLPFEQYFGEQKRRAEEEARLAAEPATAATAPDTDEALEEDNETMSPRQTLIKGAADLFAKRGNVGEIAEDTSAAATEVTTAAAGVIETTDVPSDVRDIAETGAVEPSSVDKVQTIETVNKTDSVLEQADADVAGSDVVEPSATAMMNLDEIAQAVSEPVEKIDTELATVESDVNAAVAEEAPAVEGSVDEEPAAEIDVAAPAAPKTRVEYVEEVVEEEPGIVNVAGNLRHGKDVIASLGMLPADCAIEYAQDQMPEPVKRVITKAIEVPVDDEEMPSTVGSEKKVPTVSLFADDKPPVTQGETPLTEAPEGIDFQPLDYENTDYVQDASEPITEKLTRFGANIADFFNGLLERIKELVAQLKAKWDEKQAARAALKETSGEGLPATNDPLASVISTLEGEGQTASEVEGAENNEALGQADATSTVDGDMLTVDADSATVAEEQLNDQTVQVPRDDVNASAETAGSDDVMAAEGAEGAAKNAPLSPGDTMVASIAPAVEPEQKFSTQIFDMTEALGFEKDDEAKTSPSVTDVSSQKIETENKTEKTIETVESLMRQIKASVVAPKKPKAPEQKSAEPSVPPVTNVRPIVPVVPSSRLVSVPDPSLPSVQQNNPASRTALFDLPDPASDDADPFATQLFDSSNRGIQSDLVPNVENGTSMTTDVGNDSASAGDSPFSVISSDEAEAQQPVVDAQQKKKKGLGGLFGRKKKDQQSMSDWLGVDEDFDAKNSGRDIGSWDNFEGDDWKGGAVSSEGMSEEDMIAQVAAMDDDELLGHDIWFVATGASEYDHAGMKAFLETHRDKLRGVFFINLESIGAGRVAMLANEGTSHVLKGDRRIMNLVGRVASKYHADYPTVEIPGASTDAYEVLDARLRALTIAGVEGDNFACARTYDDLPHNIEPSNIAMAAEVVTEVIRRS